VHLAPAVDWVAGLLLPAAPGVLHRRAVCFLKPDWLLVLDRVTPLAPGPARALRWSWHLGQELTPTPTPTGLLASAPSGPGLALDVAASAATTLALEPGFFATGYLQAAEVPVAVVAATLTGPLVAATLLRIVPDGATPPPATLRVAPLITSRPGGPAPLPLEAGCVVTVTAGDRTAELLWAEPGAGRKHLGDWTTDGDLLLAVTGAAGPTAWALGARRVTWRGTPFACPPFPPFRTTPACQGSTP
jgi:hypothetical protein